MNNKTIKTGNPFSTLVIMRDKLTREPVEITADMQITSSIVNLLGRQIATCDVTVCDQAEIKGGVILNVDQTVTADWDAGTAKGDIKVKIGGVEKNSVNYSFIIERSITS